MRTVRAARRPRTQSMLLVMYTLRANVPSSPPVCVYRRSESGRLNLRYQAETNGLPWTVDIYQGHYYRARVGSAMGDILRSLPSLIGYLCRYLGVTHAVSD
jgi:hypothetical protein